MISYRQADLFNTLEIQDVPITMDADLSSNMDLQNDFFIRFRDMKCKDAEVKSKFKTILYPILEEGNFIKKGESFIYSHFGTMSGAEANFMDIFTELKNDPRIKSVVNKLDWVPRTRNKVIHMTILIRG